MICCKVTFGQCDFCFVHNYIVLHLLQSVLCFCLQFTFCIMLRFHLLGSLIFEVNACMHVHVILTCVRLNIMTEDCTAAPVDRVPGIDQSLEGKFWPYCGSNPQTPCFKQYTVTTEPTQLSYSPFSLRHLPTAFNDGDEKQD